MFDRKRRKPLKVGIIELLNRSLTRLTSFRSVFPWTTDAHSEHKRLTATREAEERGIRAQNNPNDVEQKIRSRKTDEEGRSVIGVDFEKKDPNK